MTNTEEKPLWCVVPAAGRGSRIGSVIPKQYLSLGGVAVLQRTLDVLLRVPGVQKVFVATQPEHAGFYNKLDASSNPLVEAVRGYDLRVGSVASGVAAVRDQAGDDAWVLVHDAARPLVSVADICNLVNSVIDSDAVGGLLASPAKDTIKKADNGTRCVTTVPREGLWLAQTPQLFKAGQLADAIDSALDNQHGAVASAVTDEASVFELMGMQPLLVEAQSINLKITMPQDFLLAEAILSLRDEHSENSGAARVVGK